MSRCSTTTLYRKAGSMLIGINGKLGSGKNTFAHRMTFYTGQYGLPDVEEKAFADPLKNSACAVLGITREQMEQLKREDDILLEWTTEEYSEPLMLAEPINMRTLLQRYGTEAHRDIFGDDFWVKATLPDSLVDDGRLIVVTDCRFDNEAERIRAMGGLIFEIRGPGHNPDAWDHPSEKPLSEAADIVIDNSVRIEGDWRHLDTQVQSALEIVYNYMNDED